MHDFSAIKSLGTNLQDYIVSLKQEDLEQGQRFIETLQSSLIIKSIAWDMKGIAWELQGKQADLSYAFYMFQLMRGELKADQVPLSRSYPRTCEVFGRMKKDLDRLPEGAPTRRRMISPVREMTDVLNEFALMYLPYRPRPSGEIEFVSATDLDMK